MTWTAAVWFAVGLILGMAHAAGIWRAAKQHRSLTALLGLVRLLIVGLTLVSAAILGGIFPAAAGWASSFFASVILRSRSREDLDRRDDAEVRSCGRPRVFEGRGPNAIHFERNGASHRCREMTIPRQKSAASAEPITTKATVDGIGRGPVDTHPLKIQVVHHE